MTEPCPECKGKCCRNQDFGYRVEHMGAEYYEHVCEACFDGDYEVRSEPEPFVRERTALDERRDVLAWLRDVSTSPAMSADEMVTLHWVARAIFGMEHVGAAARKETP